MYLFPNVIQIYKIRLRIIFLFALVHGLTACTTTPNLSGWAQNSAELAGAIRIQNKEVLDRLDSNLSEMQIGSQEKWDISSKRIKKWNQRRDTYYKNTQNINAVMTTMVLYSNSLSDLAAAGETGSESVDKIKSSVGDIVDLFGASNPISGSTLNIIKEFAAAWTKVGSQKTLAEAMEHTDPAVKAMAEEISNLVNSQKKIINALFLLERQLIRYAAGPNRMSWYTKNNGYLKIEEVFKDDKDVEKAAAMTYLIESLEVRFRERETRRSNVTQWHKERKQALDTIAKAAFIWRHSHLDAAKILKTCGGWHSLAFKCGNYTAANIKLAVASIKSASAKSNSTSQDVTPN